MDKVITGDCREVMAGMEAESVDIILTDPPYFLPATHYQTRAKWPRSFGDLGILESFFRDFMEQSARVLKKGGELYLFCDGQSYPIFYYHAYFNFHAVRPLIWDKLNCCMGYGWRHRHELILYATKSPNQRASGYGDVLQFKPVSVNSRIHPAEKPVKLLKFILEQAAPPRARVLDPFAGSGSTGIACFQLGLDFTGIEISSDYATVARARLQAERENYPLLEEKKEEE